MSQNQKDDEIGTLAVKYLIAKRAKEWVQREQEKQSQREQREERERQAREREREKREREEQAKREREREELEQQRQQENRTRRKKFRSFTWVSIIVLLLSGIGVYQLKQTNKGISTKNSSTERKNVNLTTISVMGSGESCGCGSHSGAFKALYENREISVNFWYNPTEANPVEHPITITNFNKPVKDWSWVICSTGDDICPVAGVKMKVYGFWGNSTSFNAYTISIEDKNIVNWSMGAVKFDSIKEFMHVGKNSGTIVSVNPCRSEEGDRRTCHDLLIKSENGKTLQASFYANVTINVTMHDNNKIPYSYDAFKDNNSADIKFKIYPRICRNLVPGNKVEVKVQATESNQHTITNINITNLENIGICNEGPTI